MTLTNSLNIYQNLTIQDLLSDWYITFDLIQELKTLNKIINFFFGEEENVNGMPDKDLHIPYLESFLCNFSMLFKPDFFQYLIKRLWNNRIKELTLILSKSDDVYDLLKVIEPTNSLRKLTLKAFKENDIELLIEKLKEFHKIKRYISIKYSNKWDLKSFLNEEGMELE